MSDELTTELRIVRDDVQRQPRHEGDMQFAQLLDGAIQEIESLRAELEAVKAERDKAKTDSQSPQETRSMGDRKMRENPDQWAGCYTLHLYCRWENDQHPFDSFPAEYNAQTREETMRAARADGWKIHRDRTATCPMCVRPVDLPE